MLGDEPSIHNAIHKVLNLQDHLVILRCRRHSGDDKLIQSALHARNCLRPVLAPDDELAQQGVVVWRYLALQACDSPGYAASQS